MSATPVSVTLPAGEWTDLYASTGIAPGAVLLVQNIGSSDVRLATSTTEPDEGSDAYQVIQPNNFPMKNDGGSAGEWAFSSAQQAKLNVRAF